MGLESKKKIFQIKFLLNFACLAFFLFFATLPLAHGYYSFNRNGQRTTWPTSVIEQDFCPMGTETFQGTDLCDLSLGTSSPNDGEAIGILMVVDARFTDDMGTLLNCTDGPAPVYGPPLVSEYLEVYDALATWDQVATSNVQFGFICSIYDEDMPILGDITIESFNNIVGDVDLEIWNSDTDLPIFNGYNEIVFDDTPNKDILEEILPGIIDPNAILGIAFPFDPNMNLISDLAATGEIAEAFFVLNVGENAPFSQNIQAVTTHELGHLLGLGHTVSINASMGLAGNTPSMYFTSVGGSVSHISSLEPDDIAGITVSYPIAGEPLNTFGSMGGTVSDLDLGNIPGTGIVAMDGTGEEISVIVGGNPDLTDDQYVIEGVPPGTYDTVRLLALNGGGQAAGVNTDPDGNVDGIFAEPPFVLETLYFDDVSDEDLATPVTVLAPGDQVTGIDFLAEIIVEDGLNGVVIQGGGCDNVFSSQIAPVGASFPGAGMLIALTAPFLTVFLLKRKYNRWGKFRGKFNIASKGPEIF